MDNQKTKNQEDKMNKKQLILISVIFGISAFSTSAFAAEKGALQSNMETDRSIVTERPTSDAPAMKAIETATQKQAAAPLSKETLSKDTLIGKKLFNDSGSDLGKVVDVFIDKDTNKIAYLIIQSGGVLGVGSTERAIPFQAVTQDMKGGLSINMSDASFEKAPEIVKNLDDRTWGQKIHEFFGVSPYWETTEEQKNSEMLLEEGKTEE